MIETQIQKHQNELQKKFDAYRNAILMPSEAIIAFAAPLEAAGVTVKFAPDKCDNHKSIEAIGSHDQSVVLLNISGGLDTNEHLLSRIRKRWAEENEDRQTIARNFINMRRWKNEGLIQLKINIFKEPEFIKELDSLQNIILENQQKAVTYNSELCAEKLSNIFNVSIAPPYGMGEPLGRPVGHEFYITEHMRSPDAANNAASKINNEFYELGLYNKIRARTLLNRVDLKFNKLEHQIVLEELGQHVIDLAPILVQAEQERRKSLTPLKRTLEDIHSFILS
jgi:hypothetical protein